MRKFSFTLLTLILYCSTAMPLFADRSQVIINNERKAEEPVSAKIIEVTSENFAEVVAHADKPLIIDVYSTSCGPCRMMEPILKELSQQYEGSVQFVKINCDTQPELAAKYGVTQLPTLLFIKPGQEAVALKTTGFTSKKILDEKIVNFVQ